MQPRDWHRFLPIVLTSASVVALAGCNTAAHPPHSLRPGAPALNEENARTNPNGPYMVSDRSTLLRKRPTLVDINAAPDCQAADLSLFESGANVDGDRRTVRLNLVNHAAGPCRLSGFPAVTLLREDGSLIGEVSIEKVTATRLEASVQASAQPRPDSAPANQPSVMVLLAPAGQASFELGWTTGRDGAACATVGAIAVSAPGSTHVFTVRHTLNVCDGRITVTALADAGL